MRVRECTRSRPSSSRSVGASPATAFGRRSRKIGDAYPARAGRGAERDRGPRLDGPGRVEHPRRAHRRRRTGSGSSTSRTRTSTSSATASPCGETMTLDELRPHLHAHAENPGLDPVSHVVLRADLGLLPHAGATRSARRRAVRRRDRQHARARLADVRRVLACGRERGARFFSRPTSATLRSRTTTFPGSRCSRALAATLARTSHRLSYRFLFIPGTIGSLAWLAANEERLSNDHGAGSSSRASATPARSRTSAAAAATLSIDRAGAHVASPRRGGGLSTSSRGDGTSGSSTRPASISPSAA